MKPEQIPDNLFESPIIVRVVTVRMRDLNGVPHNCVVCIAQSQNIHREQ